MKFMSENFGVLEFRYDHFKGSRRQLSINIGDNIQSIAVRLLLNKIGVPDERITPLNRDNLSKYKGHALSLVMNGVFSGHCFPIPDQIKPIFIGFCTNERTIFKYWDYLKKHEPIGCRDSYTTGLLLSYGISAYTTGCLSMTLEERTEEVEAGRVFIVKGDGEGAFPEEVLGQMPSYLQEDLQFVSQRMPVSGYPITDNDVVRANDMAWRLLKAYRECASIVITPLLHAASPCVAMGIPTIIVRHDASTRFSAIDKLMPVYTSQNFNCIDWNAKHIEVAAIRSALFSLLRSFAEKTQSDVHYKALGKIFGVDNPKQSLLRYLARKSRIIIGRLRNR